MDQEKIDSFQVESANSGKPYEPPMLVELEIADTEFNANAGDDGMGFMSLS